MKRMAGWIVLAGVFCIQSAKAQTTGTISGMVRDATGAIVPGASVNVKNIETGSGRTLQTSAQGRYQAASLMVGQYEVEVSVSGFQTEIRRGITLTVGQEAVVNFALQVGQVSERVEVSSEAPLVEATNATITGLADEDTIRDLPLNGRSFTDIVTLQVGTVLGRSDRGSELGGGDALGGGAKISISGARPGQNSYLLDGTDVNDSRSAAPGAASGLMLGVDSVREFRLLTNSYSAEYGRASGGVLTAVTKSGTNELHGTLFEFFRNSKLDAARWEDTARGTGLKPDFKRNQFGFTLGGPVMRNRTFFFGSFEALRDRLGGSQLIFVPTPQSRARATHPLTRPWLEFYPVPNGPILDRGDGTGELSYVSSQPTDQDYFSLRGDHSFSQSHSMFARYTFDDSQRLEPSRPLPHRQDYRSRNHYLTIQYDSILSPTTLNTARFGMNRSKAREAMTYTENFDPLAMTFVPDKPFNLGGQLVVEGIATIGTNRVPRGNFYRLFEGSDDLTLIRGSHTLKTGAIFKKVMTFEETTNVVAGNYSFNTLEDFLQGVPLQFGLMWPGAGENRDWDQKFFGAYIQDDFKWRPNLTINLGVRLEFLTGGTETDGKCANITAVDQVMPLQVGGSPPAFARPGAPLGLLRCPLFETFKNNWAPRVGFAWDTRNNSKLVLRGGFGLFYDQPFTNFWKAAGRSSPPYALEVIVANPPAFARADTFLNFNSPPVNALDARPYDYTGTTYMMQYNLNVQSELRQGTGVTLGYAGSLGRKLVITRQLNVPASQILPDGRKQFLNATTGNVAQPLINPMWSSVLMGGTQGGSHYNALLVSVNQRFRGGLRAQLSYTYGKTMSHNDTVFGADFNAGDGTTGVMDGYDIGRDWGVATYNLKHSLSVNYSYDLPFRASSWADKVVAGWQLSGIISRQSGVPFSAQTQYRPDHQRGQTRFGQQRPDLVPGKSNNPILGGPDAYFDRAAFSNDRDGDGRVTNLDRGFFGNLGRNTLTGPGLVNLDLSLQKNTPVMERASLQFRAEFFNIANHPNFRNPEARIFMTNGNVRPETGRVAGTSTKSRQVQFALKLLF